jgi:hypothetical protein
MFPLIKEVFSYNPLLGTVTIYDLDHDSDPNNKSGP